MIRIFTNSEQFIPAVARISVRIMVLSRMKAVRQGLAWILQLYIVDNSPTHKPKARNYGYHFVRIHLETDASIAERGLLRIKARPAPLPV
jgi:hypothetical protein